MKATDTFRHPAYRHNCAQAIANKWKYCYADKNIMETYKPYVGGRAPEGYCGAIFAAMQACPEAAEKIKEEFVNLAGSAICREIKSANSFSCHQCVDLADSLLEKYCHKSE